MHADETFFSKFASHAPPFDVRSCELPVQYRDGTWCGLLYRIDLARARFFCDALTLEPRPFLGAAVAGVYAFEHRDTSLGPYTEIGIGILARRRAPRHLLPRLSWGEATRAQGMLVLASPVTTDAACRAGQQLWGLPRYLTRMRTQSDEHGMRVRMGTELELELGPVRGVSRHLPIDTFSCLHGQLLRTSVDVRGAPTLGKPTHAALHLLGGDGPSAEIVQTLGLHRLRPVLAFHAPTFKATMPAGRFVGLASR